MRRNRRRGLFAFRRNQFLPDLGTVFKAGGLMVAGFAAQKAMTKILSDLVLDKLFAAAAPAPAPANTTPPPASGLGQIGDFKGIIAGGVGAVAGIIVANQVVKDQQVKTLITGGLAAGFLHTVLVTLLDKVSPEVSGYLAGYDDGTAARLSAMYGLGAGASIMPHYSPINGMGEYFSEPMSGMGEYFTEGMSGLGNYGPNPDFYQAAAGMGALPNGNTNHVDPASDLDRELTIAEAAAGVGQLPAYEAAAGMGRVQSYEAAAGMGEYFSEGTNGLGSITRVPAADTWIPGTTNPQLWAGVRGVTRPQGADALTTAGILQTDGGQGVFG
jgi:hypothetical protein